MYGVGHFVAYKRGYCYKTITSLNVYFFAVEKPVLYNGIGKL